MNDLLRNYDYPMSWSCWRSLCAMHGEMVPPNVDYDADRPCLDDIDKQLDLMELEMKRKFFPPSFNERTPTPNVIKSKQHKPYPTNLSKSNQLTIGKDLEF